MTEKKKQTTVKKKRALGKTGVVGTAKKTISSEELEITEPNREDTPIPDIQTDPTKQFIDTMKEDNLPPEAKGRNQYIFHRQTGRQLASFKEIYENRKDAFEIWAKTYDYALELFIKRSQWKRRKGDTPCPIPKED